MERVLSDAGQGALLTGGKRNIPLKSAITGFQVAIRPEQKGAFVDWQAEYNSKIANAPGFVSLEFLSPAPDQKAWAVVQRFADEGASKAWLGSEGNLLLMGKLRNLAGDGAVVGVDDDGFGITGNITEVIVTEVSPGKEEGYRAWSAKIHQVEAQFPGFRGVYIQSPDNQGKLWITLLQFDSMENLDRWLRSPERKQVLQEASFLISSYESHRVISPYSGWFASIAKTGALPSLWKQTMLVLLVLFPIVALELRFLSPLMAGLNSSLGTFIGNAISVTLISFPAMPVAIHYLGWWLVAKGWKTTLAGTFLVGMLYVAEIALFWNFLR